MAYYQFKKCEDWQNYRDIDKKINFEELKRRFAEEQQQLDDLAAEKAEKA